MLKHVEKTMKVKRKKRAVNLLTYTPAIQFKAPASLSAFEESADWALLSSFCLDSYLTVFK